MDGDTFFIQFIFQKRDKKREKKKQNRLGIQPHREQQKRGETDNQLVIQPLAAPKALTGLNRVLREREKRGNRVGGGNHPGLEGKKADRKQRDSGQGVKNPGIAPDFRQPVLRGAVRLQGVG